MGKVPIDRVVLRILRHFTWGTGQSRDETSIVVKIQTEASARQVAQTAPSLEVGMSWAKSGAGSDSSDSVIPRAKKASTACLFLTKLDQ
jgi:hypothetical protein